MLLTRPPLSPLKGTVRLACIKHAASVCPEPGSNSPNKNHLELLPKLLLVHLEELTRFICLLTTLQLLRFWQKKTGGFPPATNTHLPTDFAQSFGSVPVACPLLFFGRYCSDLSYYTDSPWRCQAKTGQFPKKYRPVFASTWMSCGYRTYGKYVPRLSFLFARHRGAVTIVRRDGLAYAVLGRVNAYT